jgi:hypothetical protein
MPQPTPTRSLDVYFAGAGLSCAAGLPNTPALIDEVLRLAEHKVWLVTERLPDRLEVKDDSLSSHEYLGRMIQPGNVVITSNWDVMLERAAQVKGVPVRLAGRPDNSSLLVLKLHGSIDWCTSYNAKHAINTDDYAMLSERLFPSRPYTVRIPQAALKANEDDEGPLVRARSLEHWNDAWRRLRSRILDPHRSRWFEGSLAILDPSTMCGVMPTRR